MKKIYPFLLSCCLCFFMIHQINAQESTLTKKQMYEDFDEMVRLIEDCDIEMPFIKSVTGYDQLQMIKNLRNQIDSCASDKEFEKLLTQCLNYTFEGHCTETHSFFPGYDNLENIDTVAMNKRAVAAKAESQYAFFSDDGKMPFLMGNPFYYKGNYFLPATYCFFLPDSPNEKIVLSYSRIISWNNIPFAQYVENQIATFRQSGTRWDNQLKMFYSTASQIPDQGLLKVEKNGVISEINLDLGYSGQLNTKGNIYENISRSERHNRGNAVYYFEKDKILYVYLREMQDANGEIPKKIKEIGKDKNIEKIIVDIRGNKGGGDEVWMNVLSAIIADSLSFNINIGMNNNERIENILTKNETEYLQNFYKNATSTHFAWMPGRSFLVFYPDNDYIEPDDNSLNYKGKIYVIQNDDIYSSARSFATFASYSDQLVSVGTPISQFGGLGVGPSLFQLKNSKFTFRMIHSLDLTNVKKASDIYRDKPEIDIDIPLDEYLRYKQDSYYNRQSEEYLYEYDYVFKRLLEEK